MKGTIKTNKAIRFIVIALILIQAAWLNSCKKKSTELPNILLILADDMGYSDLNCYGGEIQTPNLDQLAENGIRFTQFYNTARSCPTRASLLTGLYPHQTGIGHMTHINNGPGYIGYLNDSCFTIPELLQTAGYSTGISGKWHAGTLHQSWPENRGFEHSFSIHNWVDSYFKVLEGCEIYENGEIVIPATKHPENFQPLSEGEEWYTSKVFADKAIEHIRIANKQNKPFFEYLAFNAPHWPLEAPDSVINKYLDKYQEGYEKLRKDKFLRMRDLGIISRSWELPMQETPNWNSLSDSAKLDTRFRRAIYAAQVETMDQNIGRVIEYLKASGKLENTLVLFLADNGCAAEPMNNLFGYNWEKNTRWNHSEWRKNSARAGASQGRIWAIASNTPFRKYKRLTHEGGISTPLIAHWPKGIKNPGSMNHKPGHLIDIMATCLDLANVSYPEYRYGIPVIDINGISLMNDFLGKPSEEHEYIFWEHEGHGALRKDEWKIASLNPSDRSRWELYNIINDRTETHDLSVEKKEIRDRLIQLWEKTAYQTKVWPKPEKSTAKPNPIEK